MIIFARILLSMRPLLKRSHTERLHLNSHNSQKSNLVKSSKNVLRRQHRATVVGQFTGAHRPVPTLSLRGRVWAMWRIYLLRPVWKTSWSSLDMVLASTGWPVPPTLSLSKVAFDLVIEWWCSFTAAASLILFFTIQLTAVLAVLVHLVNSSSCPEDILAVYKIRLETFWSEERFPKQYPQWRPPAQWSKTVGGSLCFFFNYYRDVDKILS